MTQQLAVHCGRFRCRAKPGVGFDLMVLDDVQMAG